MFQRAYFGLPQMQTNTRKYDAPNLQNIFTPIVSVNQILTLQGIHNAKVLFSFFWRQIKTQTVSEIFRFLGTLQD